MKSNHELHTIRIGDICLDSGLVVKADKLYLVVEQETWYISSCSFNQIQNTSISLQEVQRDSVKVQNGIKSIEKNPQGKLYPTSKLV